MKKYSDHEEQLYQTLLKLQVIMNIFDQNIVGLVEFRLIREKIKSAEDELLKYCNNNGI